MLGLSKALAIEVQSKGIRVHAISPGAVHTGLVELLRPDLAPDELILPSDIGDVVGFFLEHRKSNFVVDEMRMHRLNKEPFLA
jgi:NAD(P)-dependent dehydrogenase (short-subunit alcohol dehydrogenase family)